MERIELIQADDLYYKPLKKPSMIIDGILSTGLAILSGDPKIGKSWMVLQLCLAISKGEPIWGFPTQQKEVVYLALEDVESRIQSRMQDLTDTPPQNLHFGFSCSKIGDELKSQVEDMLKKHPDTGVIFIDTLQMIRDTTPSKTNAYAQDYKELSVLKKLADDHEICIFIVHHTRKETDSRNVFNNSSGSTAISGVGDTNMILQRENHFSKEAVLSITGRDIAERQLKLKLEDNVWELIGEINPAEIVAEDIPSFIYDVKDFILEKGSFEGTMSDLLSLMGTENLKANAASRYLTKYHQDVLMPEGITYDSRRTASARMIYLILNDDSDDNDGHGDSDSIPSQDINDESSSVPEEPSQSSLPSEMLDEREKALAKIKSIPFLRGIGL